MDREWLSSKSSGVRCGSSVRVLQSPVANLVLGTMSFSVAIQQQRAVSVTAPCALTLLLGGRSLVISRRSGSHFPLALAPAHLSHRSIRVVFRRSDAAASLLSVTFCCAERGASTTNATTRTSIPAAGCMVALLTAPRSHATLTTRAQNYARACGRRAPHRVVRRTTA